MRAGIFGTEKSAHQKSSDVWGITSGKVGGPSGPFMSTVFNEAAAGVPITGTKPALDKPNTAWISNNGFNSGVYQSGGGVLIGPASTTGSSIQLIDLGQANATITLSGVSLVGSGSNGFQIGVRLNSAYTLGTTIDWVPGGAITVTNVGTATTVVGTGSVGATTTGTIIITLNGTSVIVNIFGTIINCSIPAGDVTLTQTFVGFNPNAQVGGGNTSTLALSGLSAQ